jgi:hypothetical protein
MKAEHTGRWVLTSIPLLMVAPCTMTSFLDVFTHPTDDILRSIDTAADG